MRETEATLPRQSLGEVYLICLYFVCTVFTTVGFGISSLVWVHVSMILFIFLCKKKMHQEAPLPPECGAFRSYKEIRLPCGDVVKALRGSLPRRVGG